MEESLKQQEKQKHENEKLYVSHNSVVQSCQSVSHRKLNRDKMEG